MGKLVFSGKGRVAEVTLGSPAELRIVGCSLSLGDAVIAWYGQGTWHVGNHCFERVSWNDSVSIAIGKGAGARSFGPFRDFFLMGDMACTAGGVLARYSALEERWYFDRHGSQSETLVVRALALGMAG